MPFLHQLANYVDAETFQPNQQHFSDSRKATGVTTVADSCGVEGMGLAARAGGLGDDRDSSDRVRLDAERQILLTMLLAHTCSEQDATPRTFVEQVCEQSGRGGTEGGVEGAGIGGKATPL